MHIRCGTKPKGQVKRKSIRAMCIMKRVVKTREGGKEKAEKISGNEIR